MDKVNLINFLLSPNVQDLLSMTCPYCENLFALIFPLYLLLASNLTRVIINSIRKIVQMILNLERNPLLLSSLVDPNLHKSLSILHNT